ncbi:MAG: hypothetical protein AAGJ29_00855 [Pseudomonadota bacterium]
MPETTSKNDKTDPVSNGDLMDDGKIKPGEVRNPKGRFLAGNSGNGGRPKRLAQQVRRRLHQRLLPGKITPKIRAKTGIGRALLIQQSNSDLAPRSQWYRTMAKRETEFSDQYARAREAQAGCQHMSTSPTVCPPIHAST